MRNCYQGEQGPQGPKGDKGDKGDPGPQGSQGGQGETGQDGNGLLTGHGVPAVNDGKDGDSYIDLDTFDFYRKADGIWMLEGNIKGEDGDDASAIEVFYKVTFDPQGGVLPSGYEHEMEVEANHCLELPVPEKEGYDFLGWYTGFTVNDGQFTNATPVTRDITLYAMYESQAFHYIHFHSNGGSAVASQMVFDGFSVTELPTPERVNYRFLGWYLDQRLNTLLELPYVVTSRVDLYAKWEYAVSSDDYITISNADELAGIYDLSANYLLTADIDMSSYSELSVKFAPYTNPFTGVFDGGGHRIYNYRFNTGLDQNYFGLFGYNKGTIRNLKLEGEMPLGEWATSKTVGSLTALNEGIIENCASSVDITLDSATTMSAYYLGGLVGNNATSAAVIRNCYYSGQLNANIRNTKTSSGTSYYNTIYMGGIAGYSKDAKIDKCVFAGSLAGSATYASRNIGCISNHGDISNCLTLTSSTEIEGSGTIGDVTALYNYGSVWNCYRHVSVDFAYQLSVNIKGQSVTSIVLDKAEFYTNTLQFDPGIWKTTDLDYDNGTFVSLW